MASSAVLINAATPLEGDVVGGVVADAGEGFLEGDREVGELFEEVVGDAAMGSEDGDVFADEVLVLEVEAEFVVVGVGLVGVVHGWDPH